mmetsp:Transcript_23466/g.93004  ORF Transcript_23466/g.93004 Transcript_23466/m.93004 type:complete len:275 (+) Transcript_23466:1359-2183(+)
MASRKPVSSQVVVVVLALATLAGGPKMMAAALSSAPSPTTLLGGSNTAHPLFGLAHDRSPKLVKRVLAAPEAHLHTDVRTLLAQTPMPRRDRRRALGALAAPQTTAVVPTPFPAHVCEALRAYAAERLLSHEAPQDLDSVDGGPSFQVDVPWSRVQGEAPDAADGLLDALKSVCLDNSDKRPKAAKEPVAFVRRYSPVTRPRLPFHTDAALASASVNLVGEDAYEGGALAYCADGRLNLASKTLGAAVVHRGDVAHAVADVTRGERWALVVFFS